VAQSHINSMLEELQTTRLPDILQYQPPGLQGLGAAERIEVALMVPGAEEALMLPAAADAVDPAALPNPTEIRITVTWLDRAGRPMQTQGTVFVRR
jgi:hypothetical protein